MNREQRRKQAKEQRRANSKKNFIYAGRKEIPIDQIQHDPNLKDSKKCKVQQNGSTIRRATDS